MAVAVGQELQLAVEKPAAGGWMIARHHGQVLLVSGALPGEGVAAVVERLGKGVAYARVVRVDEPSPDRRDPFTEPACGGCLYAHIRYPRQLVLKGEVIADAFARIGRIPLPEAVAVAGSPETGYRMRARLHVRGGRIGFFREGTHEICNARATQQLLPETADVLDRLGGALRAVHADAVREVELSENLDGSQRAIHLEAASGVDGRSIALAAGEDGITGLMLGADTLSGDPHVVDALMVEGRQLTLRRHVQAFFQGNRYLLAALVGHVVARVPRGASVVDLYAGVGLFSVAAAVVRDARVRAIEGDRVAAADLAANAASTGGSLEAVHQSVESFAPGGPAPDALIVDPPRTGLSREALERAVALRAPIVVYVSCDVATLARDARRLLDAGYLLRGLHGFDLFPNTPHVEAAATFGL